MIGISFLFIAFLFSYVTSFIFWIWILIDCLKMETDEDNIRIIWTIVIIVTYILGAFLYYIVRRPKRIQSMGYASRGTMDTI
jgi:uncharacterized BrkB/YihY/UPF0761 family membrane protein